MKIKVGFLFLGMMVTCSTMAHVNLKSPAGGETYDPGETVKIEWEETVAHDTKNWDLYFSTDGGKTYETLASDISVNALSYVWTVPSKLSKEARIKVVQDNSGGDYSDESGNFIIAGTSTASEDAFEHFNIKLFPNPASDYVHLSVSQTAPPIKNVLVSDNIGRVLGSQIPVREDVTNEFHIDVSHWPGGVYHVAIMTVAGVEIHKLVVQRH